MVIEIEVKRIGHCVACTKKLHKDDKIHEVRIQDDSGYSIAQMCNTCMDACLEYKRKKTLLTGVI